MQGELADMADPDDDEQQALVEEMRAHLKKVRRFPASLLHLIRNLAWIYLKTLAVGSEWVVAESTHRGCLAASQSDNSSAECRAAGA